MKFGLPGVTRSLFFIPIKKNFFGTYKPTIRRRMGELVTSRVNTPEFHGLFNPNLNTLIKLFEKYNYELRIAGGAVRDLLMGKTPQDIDFATTATPEQMKEIFLKEQVRMINLTGEKHGTITARINDKENFEVTTLRIDLTTDGRHAEVQFTQDWQLDANRRDLTVNAMFLDFDGTLYDYFNGRSDLEQRKVRFVGDPTSRIQEDYLRILRYFRFWGRIAVQTSSHEQEALKAIEENANGLAGISGERIWVEMKKIVTGHHATNILAMMSQLGVLNHIGFSDMANIDEFGHVWKESQLFSPVPMTIMSGLLSNENDLVNLNKRVKMSNDEFKLAAFIIDQRHIGENGNILKYYQDMVLSEKDNKLKGRIIELLKYIGKRDLMEEFDKWIPPKYPISGYDLMKQDVPKGPIFNKTLNFLRDAWKASNYTLTKEELLKMVDDFIRDYKKEEN